ncbi:MAG TPA: methyltransferase domain-containing protein [Solirubrobacteraceae bacterium]|nr:methyltransferase domain-containing protein [Solirubrobacteraceae bacterium]
MSIAGERDKQLKEAQAEDWRERAATRLERAALIERHWGEITAHLLAITGVQAGDRVLDVGTGHGEPALTAAGLVGWVGRVVGVDLSPEMIAVAKQRAALEHIEGVEWMVQDAERLDFAPASFDVVVSRNALMFLPHPQLAVSRIRDVLAPGGRFALAVVGPEPTQPQWTMTVTAIVEALGVAPPPPGAVGQPGVYSLSDPELLSTLLGDAGFDDVTIETRELVYDFSSPAEVVTWHEINPTIMSLFAGQSQERRSQAWGAVIAAATARAGSDGHVRIPSQILYASGRRAK